MVYSNLGTWILKFKSLLCNFLRYGGLLQDLIDIRWIGLLHYNSSLNSIEMQMAKWLLLRVQNCLLRPLDWIHLFLLWLLSFGFVHNLVCLNWKLNWIIKSLFNPFAPTFNGTFLSFFMITILWKFEVFWFLIT